MGMGNPVNILENISLGIDMFDCVIPTRNARNGTLFTWNGIINIKNKKWKNDFTSINEFLNLKNNLINKYSKSYLRHLFITKEHLGKHIASINNLYFYMDLILESKKHITCGDFYKWKKTTVECLSRRR